MRTRLKWALFLGAITLISGSALGDDFIPVGSEWRQLRRTLAWTGGLRSRFCEPCGGGFA